MKKSPFDLTGKVAIITGSSRGIGRATAELLAQLGAKVVVSSRKADACEEVAKAIRADGGDAHVIPCNISRKDEVERLIKDTNAHYGKIDILVCNAAVNPHYGPIASLTDEAFDKIMGSNVKSNIWLCNLVMPRDGRARRRLGDHHLFDRRLARLDHHRHVRRLEGRRLRAVPDAGRRVGAEERPHQLHRAGSGEDRFRPRACGKTRN